MICIKINGDGWIETREVKGKYKCSTTVGGATHWDDENFCLSSGEVLLFMCMSELH